MRRWTIVSVLVALVVVGTWLPRLVGEVEFYRANVWPLLRQWSDPAGQAQLAASPALADVLIAADRRLPPDARVILLTAGEDVDTSEYIAFHRALYYLSPRPVWWVIQNPEPASQRQPRWYQTSAPAQADWLLAYQVDTDVGGIDLGHDSRLVWLGGGPPPTAGPGQMAWAGAGWPLGAALALLSLLAAGLTVVAAVETRGARLGGLERAALAWPLGALVVSLGLLLGCAVGLGVRSTSALLAALTWVTCVWVYRERVRALSGWRPRRVSVRSAGVVVGLGLVVVYVGLLADGRPLQVWDSWVTWGMKARLIWQADAIPTGVYADPTRAVTLLTYPLLVPLLEAWLFTWVGAPDDRLAGLIVGLGGYAALLGLTVWVLKDRGASALVALLGAAYLASMWALSGLAGLVFADIPLAVFALLAATSLVRWLEAGQTTSLVVAALAGGALAWTKREGVVLLVLLVATCVVARRWKGAAALALAGVVIAGPWLAFVTWRGLPDWQFVPLSARAALDNLDRLPFVLGTLGHTALDPGWSLLWPLAVLGLGLVAVRGPRPIDLLPLVATLYLLVMSGSYLFSAFVPYQAHVLASVGRLMAQVAPLVAVWLVVRWLDLRPTAVPLLSVPMRRPPDDGAPANPPGSSTDHRMPAREGLGTGSRSSSRRLPPRLDTPLD